MIHLKNFTKNYTNQKAALTPHLLTNFIYLLQLTKLGCTEQATLNADITVEEILGANQVFPWW